MSYRNYTASEGMVTITPSDTTMLDLWGFYVGGTGDVVVECADGTSATFKACPVGFQCRDLHIRKIKLTSTTATLILGFTV